MRRLTSVYAVMWLCGVIFNLTACATQPAKLPPPTPVAACLPLKAYTKAEQDALNAQYHALPPDSPVAQAFIDYVKLRDANRAACQSR